MAYTNQSIWEARLITWPTVRSNRTIGSVTCPTLGTWDYVSEDTTIQSRGHNLSRLGRPGVDAGGPFFLEYTKLRHTPGSRMRKSNGQVHAFRAGIGASSYLDYPSWKSQPTAASLIAAGSRAITSTLPNAPEVDLTTMVGEIVRDGIPSLLGVTAWKEKTAFHRGLSGEYLNYQFGWLPLVSDIRKLAKAVVNSEELIRRYRRTKRLRSRRQMTLSNTSESLLFEGSISRVSVAGTALGAAAGGRAFGKYREKVSFSGAYIQYIPEFDRRGLARQAAEARRILGIRLTPDVVWNLAPWSWAVDWFGNVGGLLTNLSAIGSDGLCLEYAYVTSVSSREGTVITPGEETGSFLFTPAKQEYKQFRMVRVPSTPYGFVTQKDLSLKQKAIITALGLNRA